MNTGQMLLTIGAMLLLSTLVLKVNTTNMTTDSVRSEAQFGVIATSLITSIMEEAKSKAFDSKTDSNSVTLLSQLTEPNKLGPESGETYDMFNDFDDFNNFAKVDSSMPSAPFNILCKVVYVAQNNVKGYSTLPTWHKKLSVTVSSTFMSDTISQSTIYSYWFFR
jgi:MSHA pilin protein MshD